MGRTPSVGASRSLRKSGNDGGLLAFRWVLRLPVQQCVVTGDHGLVIVLSNGVRLIQLDTSLSFTLP